MKSGRHITDQLLQIQAKLQNQIKNDLTYKHPSTKTFAFAKNFVFSLKVFYLVFARTIARQKESDRALRLY